MGLFRRSKRRTPADARLAELTDLLHAAAHDEALAAWLRRLPALPDLQRTIEVYRVAGRMRRRGEAPETIHAITLLADEPIARAAADAIE